MANLIPQKEKRSIYSSYRNKIISFGLVGLIVSILFGAILLLPSYFLTISKLKEARASLEVLKKSVDYQKSRNTEEEIINTNRYVEILSGRDFNISADEPLKKIISLAPSGLDITSVNYRSIDSSKAEILVSGQSSTREKIISYADLLRGSGLFSKVDLPIGNLAKDKDITFNLSLSVDLKQ